MQSRMNCNGLLTRGWTSPSHTAPSPVRCLQEGAEGFEDYRFLSSGWQDSTGEGVVREGEVHPRVTRSLQFILLCIGGKAKGLQGLCTLNCFAGSRDTDGVRRPQHIPKHFQFPGAAWSSALFIAESILYSLLDPTKGCSCCGRCATELRVCDCP